MEMPSASIEDVTVSEVLELATWNRPRSEAELRNFVLSHSLRLADDDEIE